MARRRRQRKVNALVRTRTLKTISHRGGRVLIAIFAVALLLRIGAGVAAHAWRDALRERNSPRAPSIAAARSFGFDHRETPIARGHGSDRVRTSVDAPFYAYLLAAFRVLGRQVGDDRAFILLLVLQAAVGAVLVVPVFRIGRRMFGVQVAIAGAALAAVYPGFVLAAAVLRPTVWQVTGFSVAFLALLRLCHQPSREAAVTCGVLSGLVALTEPAFLWIMAAALAGAIVMTRAQRRAVALTGALSLAIAVLVISPWLLQRHLADGGFLFARSAGSLRSSQELRTAVSLGRRAVLFWASAPDWGSPHRLWYALPYAALLVLAVAAAVSMRRWLRYYLPALGAFAAATLVYAIAAGGPQERMPFEPLLFLFSAEGALLPARLAVARARRRGRWIFDGD